VTAAPIAARAELVTVLGARQAEQLAAHLPIRSGRVPVAMPRPTVAMVWHERNEGSDTHRWLRGLVQLVVS
jgi:hypothetical protein